MVVFRGVGKAVNTVVGGTAKVGVKMVGKAVANRNQELGNYIEDTGNSIIDASKGAVDSVSQFADGTIRGAYGVVKKNEEQREKGWHDIKDSTSRTVKGISSGIKYTFKSTGITLQGLKNQDKGQILHGVKNLGKVAAVTTFAVGVVDLMDGSDSIHAEEMETRNGHLLGNEHGETGVPFEQRTIELENGEIRTGTFPVFESQFSVVLAEEMYLESDNIHFRIANETLYETIRENPSIAADLGLSNQDLYNLQSGVTPEGFVWHHHEQPGVIQLVNEEIHQNTGHTGGREIWGGGSNYR